MPLLWRLSSGRGKGRPFCHPIKPIIVKHQKLRTVFSERFTVMCNKQILLTANFKSSYWKCACIQP